MYTRAIKTFQGKLLEKNIVHRTHKQGKLSRNLSRKTWSSVLSFRVVSSAAFFRPIEHMYVNVRKKKRITGKQSLYAAPCSPLQANVERKLDIVEN